MTGFPGFQARLIAMIETLGGDWLAEHSAMAAFDKAVGRRAQDMPMVKAAPYGTWAWGSTWTRFGDGDWLAAAEAGEREFACRAFNARGEGMLGEFRVVWDAAQLVRPGQAAGVGIRLASAHERPEYDRRKNAVVTKWAVHWSDEGVVLFKRKMHREPIKSTYATSEDGALRSLARIAKELGAT